MVVVIVGHYYSVYTNENSARQNLPFRLAAAIGDFSLF